MPDPTNIQPTTPGWYWIKLPAGIVIDESIRYDHNWTPIEVEDGKPNYVTDKFWTTCGNPDQLTLAGAEWIGPITPEDTAEIKRLRLAKDVMLFAKGNTIVKSPDLIRLQVAGDILVTIAKEAALALGNEENVSLRGRLCDAIARWLRLRIDIDTNDATRQNVSETTPTGQ